MNGDTDRVGFDPMRSFVSQNGETWVRLEIRLGRSRFGSLP
jgi:hypothetical protein